jgi:FdhE protein
MEKTFKEECVDISQIRLNRLHELRKQRPQFAEIFDFCSQLYSFLEGEKNDFITLAVEPEEAEKRHREGMPLLNGQDLRIDQVKAVLFLSRLIEVLKKSGEQGAEELNVLNQALEKGKLDVAGIFRACLDRERSLLDEQAQQVALPPALLEYVFGTALSYGLLSAREEGLSARTEGWQHGYCPLCGGLPGMAELVGEEGKRVLHCSTCGTAWGFPRLQCCYCGTQDGESLEYFTAEGDVGHRVDICRKCSCYLKTADSRELGEGHPMDIEDISTLYLDLLAQKEGFTKGKRGQE